MNDVNLSLAARPSIVEGMGRIFDFTGTLNEYNSSLSGAEADYAALYSDWLVVGNSIARECMAWATTHGAVRERTTHSSDG